MRIRGSFLAAAMALLGLASAACGGGATVSLSEFRGRKEVLLYFSMGST